MQSHCLQKYMPLLKKKKKIHPLVMGDPKKLVCHSWPALEGKVNENLRLTCGTDSCLKVLTGYLLSPLGQAKNDKLAS